MAKRILPPAALILAAGKGVRMKSELPKVLQPLCGRPLVSFVIDACRKAGVRRIILVVGYQAEQVKETLGPEVEYIEQKEQLGTGHALMIAADRLDVYAGPILVLAGDTPFLTGPVLGRLIRRHRKSGAPATLMTAVVDPPPPYGRIIRGSDGRLQRIVEEKDASPEEKAICEVNTSHYCFDARTIFPLLSKLRNDNAQREYYLTDIVGILVAGGRCVETVIESDPAVLLGINSREELGRAHQTLHRRALQKLMESGVTVVDPDQVVVEPDVRVGRDTILFPFSSLTGKTVVGSGCRIGPQVRLSDARIGNRCRIEFSVIEKRRIEDGETIGPFAFLTKD